MEFNIKWKKKIFWPHFFQVQNTKAEQLEKLSLLSPDGANGGYPSLKCRNLDLKTAKLEDEVFSFADKISILVSEKQDMRTRSQRITYLFVTFLLKVYWNLQNSIQGVLGKNVNNGRVVYKFKMWHLD